MTAMQRQPRRQLNVSRRAFLAGTGALVLTTTLNLLSCGVVHGLGGRGRLDLCFGPERIILRSCRRQTRNQHDC